LFDHSGAETAHGRVARNASADDTATDNEHVEWLSANLRKARRSIFNNRIHLAHPPDSRASNKNGPTVARPWGHFS
jgi:hypothetical protein